MASLQPYVLLGPPRWSRPYDRPGTRRTTPRLPAESSSPPHGPGTNRPGSDVEVNVDPEAARSPTDTLGALWGDGPRGGRRWGNSSPGCGQATRNVSASSRSS